MIKEEERQLAEGNFLEFFAQHKFWDIFTKWKSTCICNILNISRISDSSFWTLPFFLMQFCRFPFLSVFIKWNFLFGVVHLWCHAFKEFMVQGDDLELYKVYCDKQGCKTDQNDQNRIYQFRTLGQKLWIPFKNRHHFRTTFLQDEKIYGDFISLSVIWIQISLPSLFESLRNKKFLFFVKYF